MPPIAANLERVRERIARAAERAGRDPATITLVAVTKTHPRAYAEAALAAGQYDIGENRPEEAFAKYGDPAQPPLPGLRLHLIGTIQSRKAAIALACQPVLIHSIDRLKIARKLSDLAQAQGRCLDVLFEVNIAGEATKAGFSPDELRQALPELLALPGLRSHGLMTIPPWDPDPEKARPHFQALRCLRDTLAQEYPQADWSQLSIGMSDDFEVAIAEGATIVRIGSAIFGPRS
ncbi:MAG: YggS family pyridoxal phosphate-dependent enzyme [Anaerolineae bacterium]|nr:YggS family pyridoxal phosphate-dependent enzyme [Caldilineales bacterium]MCX7852142.1 YggS family pyridoxal phosphate-dependent enzyme [Caldilineales bacterium]MDW8270283.1 YggS family pyridoxal phosphate-dependent enzyme [Anaerolineae bacterium]